MDRVDSFHQMTDEVILIHLGIVVAVVVVVAAAELCSNHSSVVQKQFDRVMVLVAIEIDLIVVDDEDILALNECWRRH